MPDVHHLRRVTTVVLVAVREQHVVVLVVLDVLVHAVQRHDVRLHQKLVRVVVEQVQRTAAGGKCYYWTVAYRLEVAEWLAIFEVFVRHWKGYHLVWHYFINII